MRWKGLMFCLLLLLFQGCGRDRLSPVPPNGTILAFGDSLTVGVGTSEEKSYPAVLASLSGRTVVNAGISGEVTEDGLERFQEEIDDAQPHLIILLEGGNDILRNLSAEQTKRNLSAMIKMARGQGIPVVLVGVPEKNLFSTVHPLYEELAEQYDLVLEDSLIAKLLRKGSHKSDSVHFNDKGYRVMAETLYELLKDNGAF